MGGPVCIGNAEDVRFDCGEAEPFKKWRWGVTDMDKWVCYPPETSEALLERASRAPK